MTLFFSLSLFEITQNNNKKKETLLSPISPFILTSVSCPITPSHLSPIRDLICGTERMVSALVQTSTRAPASVSSLSHRSPGSPLVTMTRLEPDSLWT